MLRALFAALLVSLVAAVPAAAAPPGDWTSIKRDAFRHWACKADGKGEGFKVRTASFDPTGDGVAQGIGIWAVITRGGNRNQVSERQSKAWSGGWIYTTLRGARQDDRVWMQGSYYGPTEPWSDGTRVGRLADCA